MDNNKLKKMILKELHILQKDHPYKIGGLLKKTESEPEYEGRMAKQNLFKIAKYATELHNMLEDDDNLEPWVEEKIAVASSMIETVAHYMEYEKLSGK